MPSKGRVHVGTHVDTPSTSPIPSMMETPKTPPVSAVPSRKQSSTIKNKFAISLFSTLALVIAILANLQFHIPWRFASLISPSKQYECAHNYSIEMLSFDPVIIYINHFINDAEIDYLVTKYSSNFRTSGVLNRQLETVVNTKHRDSQSASVPRGDAIGECVISRMRSMLGNLQHIEFEFLQLVRYERGGRFGLHQDWFHGLKKTTLNGTERSYNRFCTVFAYLADDCVGGGTYFPHIPAVPAGSDDDKFSREMVDAETGKGLVVKPKRGNAVFWINLHMNGTGDERVRHAGLPVESGVKLGINLWSWYLPDAEIIG